MNLLKKINKGLILTIIVILVLVIYLVGIEKQRKQDKENIKITSENFIKLTDKYLVYPEEMQKLGVDISQENKDKIEKEIKTELEKLMIQNEDAINLQKDMLIGELERGYSKNKIKIKTKKTITKISEYQFDGDQVTVIFKSKVDQNYRYKDEITNEEQEQQKTFESPYDEIILQKIEGTWKIVYSNLLYEDENMMNNQNNF